MGARPVCGDTCDANYYLSDNACVACANNFTSPAGSIGIGSCGCNAGYQFDGITNTTCIACSEGKYKSSMGSAYCTSCPLHSSTNGTTGATSVDECMCDDGYTPIGSPLSACYNSSDVSSSSSSSTGSDGSTGVTNSSSSTSGSSTGITNSTSSSSTGINGSSSSSSSSTGLSSNSSSTGSFNSSSTGSSNISGASSSYHHASNLVMAMIVTITAIIASVVVA